MASRARWARIQKGLYIVDAARESGLTTATISKIENGKPVELMTIRKLASLYNVPIWWLGCFENLPEKTFAQRVYKARIYHGMLWTEFALLIGVEMRTIEKWEKGRTMPKPKNMAKLLQPLDILKINKAPAEARA